ncbi:glycosyltransferase family 2 protein [Azospirillum doebereinerae]|uniref:glycosyltransferase family 2 protein n=1 Tax=Azospirillum doebereinerae TaxID=92933 RepID=UPI00384E5C94
MNTRMVSVIAPCHNEEGVIAEFHRRLCAALDGIEEELEVVYIDDGSTDRTPFILNEICKRDPRVAVLRLSRCFGHQMALTAGLDHVEGDAVVIIDSDLQDPPETILPMLERWRSGAQVVYGQRLSRDGESRFKLVTAKVFYWLINAISDVHIPSNVGDFRLMDRTVIDALRSMPEQHRLLRAMISWLGYRQEGVPYHRERRYAGVTKYPLRKMIRLALDGLVSSSAMPPAHHVDRRVDHLRVLDRRGGLGPVVVGVDRNLGARAAVGLPDRPAVHRLANLLLRHHGRVHRPHLRRGEEPAALPDRRKAGQGQRGRQPAARAPGCRPRGRGGAFDGRGRPWPVRGR